MFNGDKISQLENDLAYVKLSVEQFSNDFEKVVKGRNLTLQENGGGLVEEMKVLKGRAIAAEMTADKMRGEFLRLLDYLNIEEVDTPASREFKARIKT